MLPGILGIMPGASANDKVISYLSYAEKVFIASTYTFSSYSIGAAAADRRIFGIIHWVEGGTHVPLSSVTIGGQSATIHAQAGHTGGSSGLGVAIVSALVVSGTSVSVVVNNAATVWGGCSFSAIRTTGMLRSTPFDIDTDQNGGTTADLTSSTNVDTDGLIIAAMTGSTNAVNDPVTWTGAVEQYDLAAGEGVHASMAWQSGLAAQTGRTILADITPRMNSGNDLAVVSWS